jgi:nucleoside-diphosphate-sugar epimerase
MPNNILLTGATGFIGSKLLQALIMDGHHVVILLRAGSNTIRINHLAGKYVPYVIKEGKEIDENIFIDQKIDTILHTATEYGREGRLLSAVLTGNVILPIQLIEKGLKHGLKRFINTDTFFCKPAITPTYLKDYVASKKILREFLMDFSSSIQVDNMRLEHVFGEQDSADKFVSVIINDCLNNKKKILLTEANQKRDFIYSSDVVNAFITVLKEGKEKIGFEEYEVGTGHSISVKEFVLKIAAITKSDAKLIFGAIPTRKDEIMDSKACTNNLNALGWYPKFETDKALGMVIDAEKKNY